MTFTEEAPVKLVPVMSISLDEVHCAVVDGDTVMVATDGTNAPNCPTQDRERRPTRGVTQRQAIMQQKYWWGSRQTRPPPPGRGSSAHAVAAALIVILAGVAVVGNAVSGTGRKRDDASIGTQRIPLRSAPHRDVHQRRTVAGPRAPAAAQTYPARLGRRRD
jgi:hypothetical protein